MAAPSGVIVGGWNYVVATYALSAVVLGAYTIGLILRLRRSRNDLVGREPQRTRKS